MEWYTIVLILGLVAVVLILVYIAIKLWIAKKIADLGIPLISDAMKFIEKSDIPLLSMNASTRRMYGPKWAKTIKGYDRMTPLEKESFVKVMSQAEDMDDLNETVRNMSSRELRAIERGMEKMPNPDTLNDKEFKRDFMDTQISVENELDNRKIQAEKRKK